MGMKNADVQSMFVLAPQSCGWRLNSSCTATLHLVVLQHYVPDGATYTQVSEVNLCAWKKSYVDNASLFGVFGTGAFLLHTPFFFPELTFALSDLRVEYLSCSQ